MKLIRLFGVAVLCAGLLTACSSALVEPNPNEDDDNEDTTPGTGEGEAMIIDLAAQPIVV